MSNKKLEKRLFFLTLYQLTGIQAGIQAGHAQIEYTLKYWQDEDFQDWAFNWKTWIVLNGGTSNDGMGGDCNIGHYYSDSNLETPTLESMEEHLKSLRDHEVNCAPFHEPDLNWCLTAIAFLVDERVFNKVDYPDFPGFCKDKVDTIKWLNTFKNEPIAVEELDDEFKGYHEEWLALIGGEKNAFLKTFVSQFRLA